MKLKGNINYTDSLIELYSRMISLQPDNGLYYFSRFLERKSIDENLDLAEKDLQMAVKYGNEVAIWYLKRRDEKEAEGK
jgi:hypothetical protein